MLQQLLIWLGWRDELSVANRAEDSVSKSRKGRRTSLPKTGVIGALLWFMILAVGVLVPAEDYRIALGWNPGKPNHSNNNPVATQQDTHTHLTDGCEKSPGSREFSCPACRSHQRQTTRPLIAFSIAAVSYLPLNICILTIAAAFVGGCAVNQGELKDLGKRVKGYENNYTEGPEIDRDRKRLNYLAESPGYSALRGIVVYLIIISGLLVAGGSPLSIESDQKEQLAQYFKLAGIFSFFGYLAGSDPTIFSAMIEFGSGRLRPQSPQGNATDPGKNKETAEQATHRTVEEARETHQAALAAETIVKREKLANPDHPTS
jgi:hypothetical protein